MRQLDDTGSFRASVRDRRVRAAQQPARLPARPTSVQLRRRVQQPAPGTGLSNRRIQHHSPRPAHLQGPRLIRISSGSWCRVFGVQVGKSSSSSFLHCTFSFLHFFTLSVCLWICGCVYVFVYGSVTTITRNCVHRSSPNWVYR